jgi:predicted 3-demethylubiquinone-9 3-methyltransferase (glyoxalase superfamily)
LLVKTSAAIEPRYDKTEHAMPKVTTFLWFNDNAQEAANHYVSVFKNAKITTPMRTHDSHDSTDSPSRRITSVTFQIGEQEFIAFNGGPHFQLNEAVSLFVSCETQPEVDELWAKLSAGGQPSRCGWLKDKFGLSWQIVPVILGKLLHDNDPVKAKRVMEAMLQMGKLDIAALQKAYDQA